MSKPLHPALDRDRVAEELYNANRDARGGRDWRGQPLPNWNEFIKPQHGEQREAVAAWYASADRAIALLVSPEELAAMKAEVATPATLS